jgi:hypothetical protein
MSIQRETENKTYPESAKFKLRKITSLTLPSILIPGTYVQLICVSITVWRY